MARTKRRHRRRLRKRTVVLIILILLLVGYFVMEKKLPYLGAFAELLTQQKAQNEHGWSLLLVNGDNTIPADYTCELTLLSNGERVDSRIYPALQRMFDDMRSNGYYPRVASGYRTAAQQQDLLDNKIQAYIDEGNDSEEAKRLAAQWVARPGTSEHQLGLAVDINEEEEFSSADEVYDWLADNAYKYGFILRYPADKTEITGCIYEPWHYRYVGEEVAAIIHEQGSCLEEYIATLP